MQEKNAILYLLRVLSNFISPEPVPEGLDPTFYHTLTYAGDVEIHSKILNIGRENGFEVRDGRWEPITPAPEGSGDE